MKNILIIDDDESIRFTLQMLLEDEGYNVFTALSADSGLAISMGKEIDLAIVDLNIPKMSGDLLILEINKVKPNIKFIINTGDSNFKIPCHLSSIGLTKNNIILKPLIDLTELTGLITKLLKLKVN